MSGAPGGPSAGRGAVAFYAPLKPPDHPAPSGDRRIARLFRRAFAEIDLAAPLASRFRSREPKGDPARQARMAALSPWLARRAVRGLRSADPCAWFTYHLYYKAADWFGPEAAAALGVPYIVAEASYAPKRAGGPWDLSHRRVAKAVGDVAAVLCLNPNDIACLEPLVDRPERLVRFPPFLDIAPYRDAAAIRQAARAEIADVLDLPGDAVWLLAVGMMRPGDKAASYRLLAEAVRRLPATPNWRLIVVGDGAARGEIESLVAQAAGGRARFAGALDEPMLARYYAAADVMAWPAEGEAFGMAMLEAQASGLAVVAGDVGGVSGVVATGESGLLTPAGDSGAFAEALMRLMGDGDLRRGFGAAGAKRVAETQSLAAAARRLEDLLEELGVL